VDETDTTSPASDTVWPPGPTRPDVLPLLPSEAELLAAAPGAAAPAAATPRLMAAEWALWGKEADETAYHVLRCSRGDLRERDFSEVITRYSPGEPEGLPQYTVSWIPGAKREPEYIALGVHEFAPADPRQAGGRSRRDAAGREIVFVRLFCLRYAQLAEHALTYQDQALGYLDLIKAVAGIQLSAGRTDPVRVTLPDELSSLYTRGAFRKQAEQVAAMLLTGRQVCVLGADDAKVADRLRFIDTVMALLPYGLHATMSAATSASSTSQDLKLRLFFASVPRAGGKLASGWSRGEDFIVTWGKLDDIEIVDQAAGLYRQWLKDVKSHAPALLADQVVPVRFTAPDIRRMVGNLPEDKSVLTTLADLARDLRAPDLAPEAVRNAVKDATKRLRRYLAGEDRPADPAEIQRRYRQSVCHYGLLADDGRLSQLKGQLYDQLLRVAFGPALAYDGFRDIEGSVGFPLHASLRTALAKFPASDWLAFLLAREGQQGFRDGSGLVAGPPAPGGEPTDDLMNSVTTETLQPRHGAVVLDWALHDLGRRGGLPTEFLSARWYLAPACEYLYPGDLNAQVTQLKRVLKLAFGEMLGKPQIDYVFLLQPDYLTTRALGQAVVAMAAGGRMRRYAEELIRQASLRARGVPEWQMAPRRGLVWLPWRWQRGRQATAALPSPPDPFDQPRPAAPASRAGPRNHILSTDSPWAHPRTLGIALVVFLALLAVTYLGVLFMLRGG
jgi:hypothetical protein